MKVKEVLKSSRVAKRFEWPSIEPYLADSMPRQYWKSARSANWDWHCQALQQFYSRDGEIRTKNKFIRPVMLWRHFPSRGYSEVVVCARDEPGLLERIASSFTESRINIFHAEVYTRSDKTALDVFRVSEREGYIQDEMTLEMVHYHLIRSLQSSDFFQAGRTFRLPRSARKRSTSFEVSFHQDPMEEQTILELQADDYLGFLRDTLRIFSNFKLNVHEAWIHTELGKTKDVFFISDSSGHRLSDKIIQDIENRLKKMLG